MKQKTKKAPCAGKGQSGASNDGNEINYITVDVDPQFLASLLASLEKVREARRRIENGEGTEAELRKAMENAIAKNCSLLPPASMLAALLENPIPQIRKPRCGV